MQVLGCVFCVCSNLILYFISFQEDNNINVSVDFIQKFVLMFCKYIRIIDFHCEKCFCRVIFILKGRERVRESNTKVFLFSFSKQPDEKTSSDDEFECHTKHKKCKQADKNSAAAAPPPVFTVPDDVPASTPVLNPNQNQVQNELPIPLPGTSGQSLEGVS